VFSTPTATPDAGCLLSVTVLRDARLGHALVEVIGEVDTFGLAGSAQRWRNTISTSRTTGPDSRSWTSCQAGVGPNTGPNGRTCRSPW